MNSILQRFGAGWGEQDQKIRERIIYAQNLLPSVTISDEMVHMIAQICIDMAVDGHRADIIMLKTARTIAAYHGRTDVTRG